MILAGDIGGTKTVLALYRESGSELELEHEEKFVSRDAPRFREILDRFLEGAGRPAVRAGCLGVAGPVIGGRVQATNLPWELEEEELARASGAASVRLLNDLEAAAYGMLVLREDEFALLQAGAAPDEEGAADGKSPPARAGNRAVIAAGTGLGEAILVWDGEGYRAVATEGGHSDFAPRNEREIELLRYLQERFGTHVSWERVLSGPGFHALYEFLRDAGYGAEPAWLAEKLHGEGDPNAAIAEAGFSGKSPLCAETLDFFAELYGAEAGNLALKTLATGGVYVGGGIAPKILPALQGGGFVRAFTAKGRFRDLLAAVPLRVATNPRTALLGAAHRALQDIVHG